MYVSSRLRAIAKETVEIASRGSYRAGDREVTIDVAPAVAGTRLYEPGDPVAETGTVGAMAVEVTNESSLDACRRLGGDVACLNFASARSAGGGFLNGAQAQEESLARASALYPCLRAAGDFYAHHRAHPELTYTDRVIYSPAVPVFRDDRGTLLAEPYRVAFLTSAAPNRAAIARDQPSLLAGIPAVLARRAARVLAVAAAHGHRTLVLGAWGCGVFGNDPALVADVFAAALRDRPAFDRVTFAVLDRARGTPIYSAFADRLGVAPTGSEREQNRRVSMNRRAVSAEAAPAAIGPYSQAIVAGGFVFCSGTPGIDPATGIVAEGIAAQTEQALRNLDVILTEAGASMASLVKTTIFYTNVEDFPVINEIYARHMPVPPPARSAPAGAVLPRGILISIEAVAVVREA